MRRKHAKEILAESFQELAENKPIDKITIGDIVDNCGYSPATFYRYFEDKYDLIAWGYSREVAGIMDQVDMDGYTWKDSLADGARWYQRNREYLVNLFLHTSGQDSFIYYMSDINYEALKKYIRLTNDGNDPDEGMEIYMRMFCHGTVCITCEWIMGKYDITPEELAEVYLNSVPQPLLALLR